MTELGSGENLEFHDRVGQWWPTCGTYVVHGS